MENYCIDRVLRAIAEVEELALSCEGKINQSELGMSDNRSIFDKLNITEEVWLWLIAGLIIVTLSGQLTSCDMKAKEEKTEQLRINTEFQIKQMEAGLEASKQALEDSNE